MTNETITQIMESNVAARFQITNEEAVRIADAATDGANFIQIWENEDWWTDQNSA